MAEALRDYVSVLKETTRLECLIESHLDTIRDSLVFLERWNNDKCWAINSRQIAWPEVPTYHSVVELVQVWHNAQRHLSVLESRLSDDERAEIMAC